MPYVPKGKKPEDIVVYDGLDTMPDEAIDQLTNEELASLYVPVKFNPYRTPDYLSLFRLSVHPRLIYYWGSQGLLPRRIACNLGVSIITLQRWANRHPTVADALEYARNAVILSIEEKGMAHLIEKPMGAKVNTQLLKVFLSALDKEMYGVPQISMVNNVQADNVEVIDGRGEVTGWLKRFEEEKRGEKLNTREEPKTPKPASEQNRAS